MTDIAPHDTLLQIDDLEERTDAFLARVETLLPLIREEALPSERARSTTPAVIAAAADIGFFSALVPKRWGGLGLGFRALSESARILARGDVSAAWQLCFLLEHNWMACHFPWETQEKLFADRNYILAAGPVVPAGSARRVEGGYRVTGKHSYASAWPNSDWAFYSSFLENEDGTREQWVFMSPRSDLQDNDDWHFAGASASGSGSFSTNDTFVPDGWAITYDAFMSGDRHEGVAHDEPLFRYFLPPALLVMLAGFATGAAERVVELARERVLHGKIFGKDRIDQPASRARWGEGHIRVRTLGALFDDLVADVEAVGTGKWTGDQLAELTLGTAWVERQALETIRLLLDGAGTSAFHVTNPLQRYLRDISVLGNHAAADWDWQLDVTSAALLGVREFTGYGKP